MSTRGIPDQYIENDRSRRQTFTTLVRALEAKARALSTLCAVDVSISVVNGGEIRRTVWRGDNELRRAVVAIDGQPCRLSQEAALSGKDAECVPSGVRTGWGSDPAQGRDVMSRTPVDEVDRSGPEPGNELIQDPVELLHSILRGDAAADRPLTPRFPTDPRAADRSDMLAAPSPELTPPPLPPRRGEEPAHYLTQHFRAHGDQPCEDSSSKSRCYVSFPEQRLLHPITESSRSTQISPADICQTSNCAAPQCRDCPVFAPPATLGAELAQLRKDTSPGPNSGYDTGAWRNSRFTEGLQFPECARGTMKLTLPPPQPTVNRHGIQGQMPLFDPRGAANECVSDMGEPKYQRALSPVPIRKFSGGVVKRRSKRLAEVDV